MNKKPDRFWLVVLLLGYLFDFLFWEQRVGVNFAIYTLICLLGGSFLLLSAKIRPARNSTWLLIPVFLFTVITFLRQEPLTKGLAFTFSFLSLFLLIVSYLGGRWPEYNLTDYPRKFFNLITNMGLGVTKFSIQVRKEQDEADAAQKRSYLWAVLRGLLIALPVLILFSALFSSADLVFEQKLSDFLDYLELDNIGEHISRLVVILLCSYLIGGIFLHATSKSSDDELSQERKFKVKPFLGITETAVVLGSVIILFSIFVGIQFRYFFGGEVNIGIEGYTYSQYARRGFSELIWVAFFSLVLTLGLGAITQRKTAIEQQIFSGLNIAIVSLVMIILISAYQRIMLGIGWHGFSRLRLYPRIFLVWLGLLFIADVVLEIVRKERYFTFAALLASIGFAISLSLVNIDDATVTHNVPRALHGININFDHISSLSTDAVPALVDEFLNPAYSEEDHQKIGAILVCYMQYQSVETKPTFDWRSFNLSRWKAKKAIDNIMVQLQEYGIRKKDYIHWEARTPARAYYECGLSLYDLK